MKLAFIFLLRTAGREVIVHPPNFLAYCTTMSINCYILPFSNCITTYGIDEKTQYVSGTAAPDYFSIYEYLMRFNHQTMIHILEQMNNVSNSNLLLNSDGHDHDGGGGGRRTSTNNCTAKCPSTSKVCQSNAWVNNSQ